MDVRNSWIKYKRKIGKQMQDLKWNVLALYLARKDSRIPLKSKIIIAITVGYLLSPIDLIPDFIPILGQLDDLIIVPALLSYAIKSIPENLLQEYRQKAKIEFRKGSPKSYKAAAIIVFFWSVILIFVIYWIGKMFWL